MTDSAKSGRQDLPMSPPTSAWFEFRYRMGRFLPHWIKKHLYPFIQWRPRTTSLGVSDVDSWQIAPNVLLDVYWLKTAKTSGPAASFYVYDDEVLRLDCLGENQGHLHINMKQVRQIPNETTPRFFFVGNTRREQVDEALYHLRHNLKFCLQTNVNRRVRAFTPDADQILRATEFARSRMRALLDKHG